MAIFFSFRGGLAQDSLILNALQASTSESKCSLNADMRLYTDRYMYMSLKMFSMLMDGYVHIAEGVFFMWVYT